jgi:hypothetical protein
MVGTTFEETITNEKGSTTLIGVISKWETNKLVAFQLDGKHNQVDVEFQLEKESGHTRVTQRAEVQFKSVTRLFFLILGSFIKKKLERELASQLNRLKELCENTT